MAEIDRSIHPEKTRWLLDKRIPYLQIVMAE